MVPTTSAVGALTGVQRNGAPIPTPRKRSRASNTPSSTRPPAATRRPTQSTTPRQRSPMSPTAVGRRHGDVTWDTDEASDSRVDYGTSPGSLDSSQSSPALASSHSVQLNGLEPNTTYYYRVTSSDAGDQFLYGARPPRGAAKLHHALRRPHRHDGRRLRRRDHRREHLRLGDRQRRGHPGADRGRGVLGRTGPSGRLAEPDRGTGGGQRHRVEREARGRRRQRWDRRDLRVGARARVQRDVRRRELRARRLRRRLQQRPRLGDVQRQGRRHVQRPHQQRRGQTERSLPRSLIGSPHHYRIEWDATEVRYFVDGSLVATHAASFGATEMRPWRATSTAAAPTSRSIGST